jgi:hypothetical protein
MELLERLFCAIGSDVIRRKMQDSRRGDDMSRRRTVLAWMSIWI